jgi:hypothetical protein
MPPVCFRRGFFLPLFTDVGEVDFCELHLDGILRSSTLRWCPKFSPVAT